MTKTVSILPRIWLTACLALLAGGVGAQTVQIPNVVGAGEHEARARIEAAGVTGKITARTTPGEDCTRQEVEQGLVCGQSPAGGETQLAILDVWLFLQGERVLPMLNVPPLVVARNPEEARARVARAGFVGSVEFLSSSRADVSCGGKDDVQLGDVCAYLPAGREKIRADTGITLIVQGPRTLEDPWDYVPEVIGKPLEEALSALDAKNFKKLDFRFVDTGPKAIPSNYRGCPSGTVCQMTNVGRNHLTRRNRTLILQVGTRYEGSKLSQTTRMPDLSKDPLSVAREKLDAIGYRGTITIERDSSCQIPEEEGLKPGHVCGQGKVPGDPMTGSVPITITIYERRDRGGEDIGKPWIRMPEVRGKTRKETDILLTGLGFRGVSFKEKDEPGCPPETVCASNPPAGMRAFLDMTQVVYFGAVPRPVATESEADSGSQPLDEIATDWPELDATEEEALEGFEPLFD